MDRKYSEFYFEKDNSIHQVKEIFDALKENRDEALEKYRGNIYCPECRLGTLSINPSREYLFTSSNNMDTHAENCSMRYESIGRKELKKYYHEITENDAKIKLQSVLDMLFLRDLDRHDKNMDYEDIQERVRKTNAFLVENDEGERRCLPRISIYSGNIDEYLDLMTIYYGKCKIYVTKDDKSEKIYGYIHVLSEKTDTPLMDIVITNQVKDYIDLDFETKIENAKTYYLSFIMNLSQKGDIYSGVLYKSYFLSSKEV